MTDLKAKNKSRLWSTLAIVACVMILSLVALWQTVWAAGGVPAGSAITETVSFSHESNVEPLDMPIELQQFEDVDVGDAPTSWNNFFWLPAPMTAYPWLPLGSANYPVVAFPPAPPSPDGYGFCHLPLGGSSLGPAMSLENEADVGWDSDGVNNIIPPADLPDLDGFDDGVVFPPSMPSCYPTSIQVQGVTSGILGPSFINVWADWNRDGDWNDHTVCGCGDDEWAVQNWVVGAPGPFLFNLPLLPCNPGSDTDPVWFRVSLTELPMGITGDPEWFAGGIPAPMAGFCFADGETEDYYVELEAEECEWVKEISINDGEFLAEDAGPFGVVLSDTVTISETLWCNFEFDWNLAEFWDPDVFSLEEWDTDYGVVDAYDDSLVWSGGYEFGGTVITLTKSLHAHDGGWITTEVTEEVDISPLDWHLVAPPIEFAEMAEGGDAPSSHNHGPNVPMLTHPAGPLANFPVVWDFDDSLGASPVTGYYGFCHWASDCPSYLGPLAGPSKSYELDADLLPDQDGKTNIDPAGGVPDRDGHDDGIFQWPQVLPQCGPTTIQVQVNNNSGGTLYLNGWADWNRDGDWEDGSICGCGDDEWAVQDIAVVAPGYQVLPVQITPCHPGLTPGDSFEPFWMRFTLSPFDLGSYGQPFTYGGFPFSAGDQGCFKDGETEDYFLEPEHFGVCLWDKAVTIDGQGPYIPEEGPFTVTVSDTVLITDTLWCSFDYDWDLWEYWDSSALSLEDGDTSHGSSVNGPGTPPEWWIHWWGGPIGGNPPVQLWKQYHVDGFPNLPEPLVITETVDFSPAGMVPTWQRNIVLQPATTYVPLVLKCF